MLSNKLYDCLKWIAISALPIIGAAYAGLAEIWGLPYGPQITRTLDCIGTALAALLGYSTYKYNKRQKQTTTATTKTK